VRKLKKIPNATVHHILSNNRRSKMSLMEIG